jgi:hypothetical protein
MKSSLHSFIPFLPLFSITFDCRLSQFSAATTNSGTQLSSSESESQCESYVTTDGQSASLSWNEAFIWGSRPDIYYCHTVMGLLLWALSLTRGRVCRYNRCWPLQAQSFSGSSPVGFLTIFYCLRFETSLFVASYDSQGYGAGIRPRLHT